MVERCSKQGPGKLCATHVELKSYRREQELGRKHQRMRLAKASGRFVILLLLSLSIIGSVTPAFSQSQTPSQSPTPATVTNTQAIIDRAEEQFTRGEEAFGKGLNDIARKMWDDALDVVLQ